MKKKVNIEEICQKFNTLRQEYANKIFTPAEMENLLAQNGIGKSIFRKMAQNAFFRVRKDPNAKGNYKQYVFTSTPIYIAQFNKVYQEVRDSTKKVESLNVESAVKLLKSLGYIIKKPVGVNESALKAALPEVYKKFMAYAEL